MKRATNIGRENLISLGTCFGKFSKTGKFKLQITALDFLAPYAKVELYHATCTSFLLTLLEKFFQYDFPNFHKRRSQFFSKEVGRKLFMGKIQ